MKICPKCKEKYEDASYCVECGEALVDMNEEQESTTVNHKNNVGKPSIEKYVILGSVVVVLAVVAILLILLTSGSKEPAVTADDISNTFDQLRETKEDSAQDDYSTENDMTYETVEDVYENDYYEEDYYEEDYTETDSGDYVIADSNSRYLSISDIQHLSKDELRLARNEIYARRGRKFTDSYLQSYFNQKDWYNGYIEPDNFSDGMLNDYEKKNAELISSYETSMGYK